MVMLREPSVLLLIPPAAVLLILLIRKNFVRFREKAEELDYRRKKRGLRIAMMITRSLIFALLIAALASPYTIKKVTLPGDASVKILVDNST